MTPRDDEELTFLRSLISEKEFSRKVGIHRSCLCSYRRRGLPFFRIRNRVWYTLADFNEWMHQHRTVVGGRDGVRIGSASRG